MIVAWQFIARKAHQTNPSRRDGLIEALETLDDQSSMGSKV
jgi:hypothetical protein